MTTSIKSNILKSKEMTKWGSVAHILKDKIKVQVGLKTRIYIS